MAKSLTVITKKNYYYYFFVFPICLVVAVLVALRSDQFSDYTVYLEAFQNYTVVKIEITFYWLSRLLSNFSNGFYYLLFVYSFLGIVLKSKFFYDQFYQEKLKLSFFIFTYICSYFILWELIQMRYSVAIAFLLLALFHEGKKRYIYFALAIAFHYSIGLIFLFFLILNFVKNTRLKFILAFSLAMGSVYIINTYNLLSQYSVNQNDASQGINFFGSFVLTKIVLFLVQYFAINYYLSRNYVRLPHQVGIVANLGLSTFLLFILLAFSHPIAGDRYFDLGLFLIFVCSMFIYKKDSIYLFMVYCTIFSIACLVAYVFNPLGNSLVFH